MSKDENLTKAQLKYLEGKLIAIGLEASKRVIHNNQSSGARLPESDQAEMDKFLDREKPDQRLTAPHKTLIILTGSDSSLTLEFIRV